MRLGLAIEPMPSVIIEELFASRTRKSLTRIRSPRQNLSFPQLKIYYEETDLALKDNFAANLDLLTEGGAYNYAAYLLADHNANTTQVAKYAGNDRGDLIERNEYYYCYLVKDCKAMLEVPEVAKNCIPNKFSSHEPFERNPLGTLWHCARPSSTP